jgi:hypothetical protein
MRRRLLPILAGALGFVASGIALYRRPEHSQGSRRPIRSAAEDGGCPFRSAAKDGRPSSIGDHLPGNHRIPGPPVRDCHTTAWLRVGTLEG